MIRPRLYVMSPSHYCERARWALQYRGIDFEEIALAPVVHILTTRRLGDTTETPLLQTSERVVQGSSAILEWTGLTGGDPDVEARVVEKAGAYARRMVYAGLLNETPDQAAELLFGDVRGNGAAVGRALWPLTRRLMIRGMRTQTEHIPAIEQLLAEELDWLVKRLRGRDYFVGDMFSRTDMTVASLLSPIVQPSGCTIYAKVRVPPVLLETFIRWSTHPMFVYVRRIYERHRW